MAPEDQEPLGGYGGSMGPATDRHNTPVIDPSENVKELVNAALKRVDDLREVNINHTNATLANEMTHIRELIAIREACDHELAAKDLIIQNKESDRIDAIRQVDVAAGQRNADVLAAQLSSSQAQVVALADTLRGAADRAAIQVAETLRGVTDPIIKDIADLRRSQYEGVGQKTQVVETQARGGSIGLWIGLGVTVVFGVLSFFVAIGGLIYAATK